MSKSKNQVRSVSKRLVILGAGESGVGTAILAKQQGFEVFVSDKGKIKSKYKRVLSQNGLHFEAEGHTEELILNATEVVKSPGIPDNAELIQKIKAKGIPVIGEIEFAARYTTAKLIGITGTNGKTTTTLLIYHILKKARFKVGLAGNVGKSFAMQVAKKNYAYYVLELSSFQLDNMFNTRINIAILTNITPDHLDRYDYKLQNYINAKFRITQNQTAEDAFIYCMDDPITAAEMSKRKFNMRLLPITIKQQLKQDGAFVNGNQFTINTNTNQFTMLIEELALQGKHNLYNSMAAGVSSRLIEVRKESIKESLSDFQNIEHRLEFVARVHGIEFINDSKATNVNSTWYALESMQNPVVWIVGGVDKGNDYHMLFELVKDKVKAIICLGLDNQKIVAAFKGIIPKIVETTTAADAVKHAYRFGKSGDVVLLSPCCASFDLFENYEDRGNQYKKAVRAL